MVEWQLPLLVDFDKIITQRNGDRPHFCIKMTSKLKDAPTLFNSRKKKKKKEEEKGEFVSFHDAHQNVFLFMRNFVIFFVLLVKNFNVF